MHVESGQEICRNSLFLFLTGCLSYRNSYLGLRQVLSQDISLPDKSCLSVQVYDRLLPSGLELRNILSVPYSYRPAQRAVSPAFPWKQVGLYNDGCPLHQEANSTSVWFGHSEDAGWNLNVIIQKATVPQVVLRNTVAFCLL